MLRIGVDMIDVERIAQAIERHGERLYARLFTEAERTRCGSNAQRLAARFAAKEAVAKALGTGIGAISWREIEIDADAQGRPVLRLHGAAAKLSADLGLSVWEVSLSHTPTHAIAFAVATAG